MKLSFLLTALLALTFACDKETVRPSGDCRDGITDRLGLQAEAPAGGCPNKVTLLLLDDTYYYRVRNIGPSCNSVIAIFDCAEAQVCEYAPTSDCRERFEEQAEEITVLGYY